MSQITLDDLLKAGVHFGHQTRRWNPKMRRFIFAERNGIHIIDLQKTARQLELAQKLVREVVLRGDNVLFVCTKRQLAQIVQTEAERAGALVRRITGGGAGIIPKLDYEETSSGIRQIAVMTQYKAQSLIQHVNRGWGYLRGEFGEFELLVARHMQIGCGSSNALEVGEGRVWLTGRLPPYTPALSSIAPAPEHTRCQMFRAPPLPPLSRKSDGLPVGADRKSTRLNSSHT